MELRAVAFDIGNTLIDDRTNQMESIRRLAQELACEGVVTSSEEFVSTYIGVNRANNVPFLSHTFGDARFFESTLRRLGITSISASKALQRYRKILMARSTIDVDIVAALTAVRNRGLRTAVLSNESVQRVEALFRKTRIDQLFDVVVVSEAAGIEKPDRRIFERCCWELGVDGSEAALFGDNEIADGACKQTGMLFVLVTGYKHPDWGWENGEAYEPDYTVNRITPDTVESFLGFAADLSDRRDGGRHDRSN